MWEPDNVVCQEQPNIHKKEKERWRKNKYASHHFLQNASLLDYQNVNNFYQTINQISEEEKNCKILIIGQLTDRNNSRNYKKLANKSC